jgi:hypothetical protein
MVYNTEPIRSSPQTNSLHLSIPILTLLLPNDQSDINDLDDLLP